MFNNPNFYPTPEGLLEIMTKDIDFSKINRVLEPSAGKGNIIDFVVKKHKKAIAKRRNMGKKRLDIDAVEIDRNLQHLLKGKSKEEGTFNLVHDNFLTLNAFKPYDLIIMNPPFDKADEHLLRALEIQQRGGKIICLTNSATIKNAYSNKRKELKLKLEVLNAEIEFFEDSFTKAERKTNVEVALIKVNIPKTKTPSSIMNNLKRAKEYIHMDEEMDTTKEIVPKDYFERAVQHFNFEVSAGVQLINEYHTMKPKFINSFQDGVFKKSILSLSVNGSDHITTRRGMIDSYLKSVRHKYWETLFASKQFDDLFTTRLRSAYRKQVDKYHVYDFTLFNIYSLRAEINESVPRSIDDTIVDLFDEFCKYSAENGDTIYLYNGWKTNKSWKIGNKVVFRLNGFNNYYANNLDLTYDVKQKLTDIEKVLNYLGKGLTNHNELSAILEDTQNRWKEASKTDSNAWKRFHKDIQFKYFKVTFYKKGTCHITFTDAELLKKFNLFGSMKKGWLPPAYGQKNYADMTKEEKDVVDEFQGEEEYKEVMANKKEYLPEYTVMNLLGEGLPMLAQLPEPEENSPAEEATDNTNVVDGPNKEFSEEEVRQEESEHTPDASDEQDYIVNAGIIDLMPEGLQPQEPNIKPKYTLSDLNANTTLITPRKKRKVEATVQQDDVVTIEASEVVVTTEVLNEPKQKTLESVRGNKAPLLLTTTYVESEEVVSTKATVEKKAIREANIIDEKMKVVATSGDINISSEKDKLPVEDTRTENSPSPSKKTSSINNKKSTKAAVKRKGKKAKEEVDTKSNVVAASSPVKDTKQKTLKPKSNKVKSKEIVANKDTIEESKIVEDILPDFISVNKKGKEGENIQLGFAI